MMIESGTVNITGAGDDGIQVEIETDNATTGTTTDHDEENSGNFYQEAGTLSISGYSGKAIKTDGTITYNGGTQNFTTSDTETLVGIEETVATQTASTLEAVYDLQGRKASRVSKGLYIFKKGNTQKKMLVK